MWDNGNFEALVTAVKGDWQNGGARISEAFDGDLVAGAASNWQQ